VGDDTDAVLAEIGLSAEQVAQLRERHHPMSAPNVWNGAGRRIFMNEVGTRDGLQMEQAFVPTEDKIALVNALSEAGLSKIEVTAFVSPKAIPALRDGEIVMREIARRPGTVYTALVPNVRGAERAIDAQTDELNLVMSVSETHNLCNLRMQRSQSFEALRQVIATAQQAATPVNVSLSCCFGCPMEGDVAEAKCWPGCSALPIWACRASRCATPRAWPIPARCIPWSWPSRRAGRSWA
jgi:hypothetical protein